MVHQNVGEALSREAAVMRGLAREIGVLQELGMVALRDRYREVFGEEPRSKNLPFLRKKIAFRMQEQMEGGLSEAAKQRIEEVAPSELMMAPRSRAPRAVVVQSRPAPGAGGRDARLPQVGARITREYQGFVHEVEVLEDGFKYRGRTYRSLSAIAKEITGTPWNGFLFFGLITRGGGHGR